MDDLISPQKNVRDGAKPTLLEREEFGLIQARRIKALAPDIEDRINDPSSGDFRAMIEEMKTPQHERSLIGVALSGGGIRSATFGLGVLQSLAELGLLRYVDYLSTVSGGGYIGGWLAAWVKREGDLINVNQQLIPDRSEQANAKRGFDTDKIPQGEVREPEPKPLYHLRQFSNYLSPQLSFFSADSWALVAIYLRNLFGNQLFLLPLIFAVVLFMRLIVWGFAQACEPLPMMNIAVSQVVAIGLILFAFVVKIAALKSLKKHALDSTSCEENQLPFGATRRCLKFMIWSWALAAIGITWLLLPNVGFGPVRTKTVQCQTMPSQSAPVAHKDAATGAPVNAKPEIKSPAPRSKGIWSCVTDCLCGSGTSVPISALQMFVLLMVLGHALTGLFGVSKVSGFVSGVVGSGLLWVLSTRFLSPSVCEPHLIATVGPPLVMLSLILTTFLEIALSGRDATEQQREWRARTTAWILLVATCWAVLMGAGIYGTLWLEQAGRWWQSALVAGWVGSAVSGVLAARSPKTNGNNGRSWLDLVGMAAPFVFLLGLGCSVSVLAHWALDRTMPPASVIAKVIPLVTPDVPSTEVRIESTIVGEGPSRTTTKKTTRVDQTIETQNDVEIAAKRYWWSVSHTNLKKLLFWLAGAVSVALVAAWRVDINEFSLNAMYANRLTRCYLGASRRKPNEDVPGTFSHNHGPKRRPNEVTGFDLHDDLELFKLQIGVSEGNRDHDQSLLKKEADCLPYWGPYPLINTALNLVGGDELAWQERMAESFVLSPLYCGTNSLGFAPTGKYGSGCGRKPLTVGRAMAISGAAANPNMGYHSSPAATALMTIFNVRLGWWLPNPKYEKSWMESGPTFGAEWLVKELFGLTNRQGKYLNISDGGHFENLGVYELIRRRCRCIIVSDAGADPDFEYEDLGGLVRKCRSDFGVDIEIDVSQLKPDSETGHSKWHCAIGTIRYDRVEATAPVGILIYIKPSLSGNEPADVQHYAADHSQFPHEPTLDQFFSESQFESYRQLGYHCASDVFRDVVGEFKPKVDRNAELRADKNLKKVRRAVEDHHRDVTENLVYQARKKWLPPPGLDNQFVSSVEGFVRVHRDLRDNKNLAQMTEKLFPQIAEVSHDVNADEIHTACQMLQVLENAWVSMKLDKFHAHPLNAGWMNLFERWGNLDVLRRYWPLLRGEFSRDFVRFCERESALKVDLASDHSKLELFDHLPEPDRSKTLSRLDEEFRREWPEETIDVSASHQDSNGLIDVRLPRGLNDLFARRWPLPKDMVGLESHAFWYLRVKLRVPIEGDPLRNGFIAGVIGLRLLEPFEKATSQERKEVEKAKQQIENCKEILRLPKAEQLAEKQRRLNNTILREIAPKAEPAYELVLWVRPGFRQQGVGQALVQSFFGKLWDGSNPTELGKAIGKASKLVVYYPIRGGWGPHDKLAKAQWLSYFAFYGFRRPGTSWPCSDTHEVLVRDMDDLADHDDPC